MEPLSLRSKAEELNFYSLIQKNSDVQTGIWHHIGGIRLENKFVWQSDFSEVLADSFWSHGEPNNAFDGENCLAIMKAHFRPSYGLCDIRCEKHLLGFFCQKLKNPTISGNTNREREMESQFGICKLLSQVLDTMLVTGKGSSLQATDAQGRKYKTTTVSVVTDEYEY